MSHFYSEISGNRGPATRAGTKSSGVSAYVQSWTGRIESRMYCDELDGQDRGYVVLTSGPKGFFAASIDLTGEINVSDIAQASVFDPETAKHLRQARASIQRANAAAIKACARRDKLSGKVA
jgi:hypothetical protein